MIKYRPNRKNISAAIKEETIFDSMDELIKFLHSRYSSVSQFIGSKRPFEAHEIIISESYWDETSITGWHNVHKICVKRLIDKAYHVPHCIGYCGE